MHTVEECGFRTVTHVLIRVLVGELEGGGGVMTTEAEEGATQYMQALVSSILDINPHEDNHGLGRLTIEFNCLVVVVPVGDFNLFDQGIGQYPCQSSLKLSGTV